MILTSFFVFVGDTATREVFEETGIKSGKKFSPLELSRF